jgi:hypothetical protein
LMTKIKSFYIKDELFLKRILNIRNKLFVIFQLLFS